VIHSAVQEMTRWPAERCGSLEIAQKFELRGLVNRSIGRHDAADHPLYDIGHPCPDLRVANCVGHQPARLYEGAERINRRQAISRCKFSDLLPVSEMLSRISNQHRIGSLRLRVSDDSLIFRVSRLSDHRTSQDDSQALGGVAQYLTGRSLPFRGRSKDSDLADRWIASFRI
jgi:hypothetical protein